MILLIYVVEFTFHQQLKLKSLNYYLQQVHTGVEIVTTKCYNVCTAFFDKKELKAHLQMLEERKERDYLKLVKS